MWRHVSLVFDATLPRSTSNLLGIVEQEERQDYSISNLSLSFRTFIFSEHGCMLMVYHVL